jgi:hypothetical protein
MSLISKGIEHKTFGDSWAAVIRLNVMSRAEIKEKLDGLSQAIPPELVSGPAFWIRYFVNSYTEGFDAEIGLPVTEPFASGEIVSRYLPKKEVLSKTLTGEMDQLGKIYQELFACQREFGLITDEFCVEVLHSADPQEGPIEVLFVRHPWEELFKRNLTYVLGLESRETIMGEGDQIFWDSSQADRFEWVKGCLDRLDLVADDLQRYEILSACSHVFPQSQAEKMREIYQQAVEEGAGLLEAVDQVVVFMKEDPGWRPNIIREGSVLYNTKNPSNPEAYAKASTDLERKQAYCFCPLISEQIEDGMSDSFCYCSSGWERKQWEVALGQPLRIEVVKSLLKGDLECQFAIHLPEG